MLSSACNAQIDGYRIAKLHSILRPMASAGPGRPPGRARARAALGDFNFTLVIDLLVAGAREAESGDARAAAWPCITQY